VLFICLFISGLNIASQTGGQFTLVLDPGHGGRDAGAVGRKGKEKDINLAVSLLVKRYIAEAHPNVKIVCTREKDVFIGLDERADIANRVNANLFISIHANSLEKGHSKIHGAEVYTFGLSRTNENLEAAKRENSVILLEDNYQQKYAGFDPKSSESYIIFEFMQNKFVEQSIEFASMTLRELTGTAKRSDRGVRQAAFLVLRKSTMPRILIELDFISNPQAEEFMLSDEGQKLMARAISRAFAKYKKEFDRRSGNTSGKTSDPPNKQTTETEPAVESKPIADTTAAPESQTTVEQSPLIPVPLAPESVTASSKPGATASKTQNNNSKTIIYKVQILLSDKELPENSKLLKGCKAEFYREGKWYKYTVGSTSSFTEISRLHKELQKKFPDAFIIIYEDGVKKVYKP
jgi:N-acetylmuramoyl-L-alanine amidase